jgi:hypothetical protein
MKGIYDEATDLLASGVTAEQLLAFRPSDEAQRRFEELIAREKRDGLLAEESEELDRMMEVNRILSLAKAKARLRLNQRAAAGE